MNNKCPIFKISVFNSFIRMLQLAPAMFMGIYFSQINLSGGQIGVIFAVYTVTGILSIIPSSFSNDKFKSKNLIVFSLVLLAIQFVGIGLTHDFILISILIFFGGLGKALYTSSADSLFLKSTKKTNVNKKIATFQSLQYTMIGLGMILIGFTLNLQISFEKIFIVIGFIYLLMTIVAFLNLPDNRVAKFEIIHYKKDIFRPKVVFLLIIMFLFSFHFGAEQTTYGLFLKETLELSSINIGLYMGIAVIFMAFTSVYIGKKLPKWTAAYVLIFALFTSGLGHILMVLEPAYLSVVFRIIHEIGDASMFFFLYYGISKMFDLERIGGNSGIFKFIIAIGTVIGALIFGPMGEAYGYHLPLIVSGSIQLFSALLALPFIHLAHHE
ncbi:MFS transporter [Patescibacteria group bacterium]